ncbi:MAG TPA: 5'-nucleotidase C-terminal domain-containing protein [Longimicrobiaceae bacterium]|nr:5'-nucleotidase C-terminal domain-containing protein [Longimicrobiaceae bacterium]
MIHFRVLQRRLALVLLALFVACAPAGPSPSTAPAAEGTLVLMGTTDLHGWLLPEDYYTGRETAHGLARLAPIIDSIRAEHPGRTALLDSGDLLQGNPLAFVYSRLEEAEDHPIVRAMNLLRYDAVALGNHEFNFGIEQLDRAVSTAEFPFLSANIFRHGTQEHAYRPSVMLEREIDGRTLRIGVTAATPPGVHVWDRDHVEGRLEFRDIVESIRPVVADLRARGADLIVVAAHSGLEGTSYDTLSTGLPAENVMARLPQEVPGIDVIFLGHTHEELADTTIGGALVLQARNWAQSLAVAELQVAAERGGEWQVVSKRGQVLRPDPSWSARWLETALSDAHERTQEYVARTIGTSTAHWSAQEARVRDTPILDFINEVQRRVAGADLSSAAAFNLGAEIPEGPVTVADIARLYIYDNNTLKAVRISGAELRAYLEKSAEYYLPCPAQRCERVTNPEVPGYNFDVISGVDYALDLTRPIGQRVVRLERAGQPVAPTDSFTLALNNYRQGGGGGFTMVARAPVVYDRGESIRELLIREVERRGRISPEDYFRQNWEIVPSALAQRALAEQLTPGARR